MESEKLLPCPFCGGEGVMGETEWGSYFAGCRTPDCPAEGGAFDFVDAKSAADHWNTRAPADLRSALEAEPFGYWVEQKHADPVLLRKPAYIPEPSDLRTVTPLYRALAPTKGDVS